MENEKVSKEMKDIMDAVEKFERKHDGNVLFVGSFMAFNKNSEVIDDRMFCYGVKKTILLDLKELKKEIKKDKEDFINW